MRVAEENHIRLAGTRGGIQLLPGIPDTILVTVTYKNPMPRRLDHKVGFIGDHPDDAGNHGERSHFDVDAFPDTADQYAAERRDSYQEQCEMLRRVLKPDYAEMIIAVHLDGLSLIEYAAMIGDKPNNVSHRLQRAEKKLKEILQEDSISLDK